MPPLPPLRTHRLLMERAQQNLPIAMMTAYDASLASLMDRAGMDAILVGDSLGNVIQGHTSTVPVSVDDVVYHVRCVARAKLQQAVLIADLPYMSYATAEQALRHATELMQAGANMVKLEGGAPWCVDVVTALTERGVPVCGHLGLLPQRIDARGHYRQEARDTDAGANLLAQAHALVAAGATLLVLECIPSTLAAAVTQDVSIPTVGIGAGPHCNGQVLVGYDALGMTPGPTPSFAPSFLTPDAPSVPQALAAYVNAVHARTFPMETS